MTGASNIAAPSTWIFLLFITSYQFYKIYFFLPKNLCWQKYLTVFTFFPSRLIFMLLEQNKSTVFSLFCTKNVQFSNYRVLFLVISYLKCTYRIQIRLAWIYLIRSDNFGPRMPCVKWDWDGMWDGKRVFLSGNRLQNDAIFMSSSLFTHHSK
jgi:hypothetical protein